MSDNQLAPVDLPVELMEGRMLLCAARPLQTARPREFEITPQSWCGIAILRTRMNRGNFPWLFPIGMADKHFNRKGAIQPIEFPSFSPVYRFRISPN